jgi:hypothetical protein
MNSHGSGRKNSVASLPGGGSYGWKEFTLRRMKEFCIGGLVGEDGVKGRGP